jgi:hypothetical protein
MARRVADCRENAPNSQTTVTLPKQRRVKVSRQTGALKISRLSYVARPVVAALMAGIYSLPRGPSRGQTHNACSDLDGDTAVANRLVLVPRLQALRTGSVRFAFKRVRYASWQVMYFTYLASSGISGVRHEPRCLASIIVFHPLLTSSGNSPSLCRIESETE